MKRIVALLVLLLTGPVLLAAQTSTAKLEYDYVNTSVTEVATYTQAIKIDNVAVTGTPTCAANTTTATTTTCSIPITPLAAGTHVISIKATKGSNTAETVVNWTSGVVPTNPSNFKYSVTVNVNVP